VVLEEESGESESETSKTPKKTIGAVRKSTAKTKKKLMSWQSKKFQPPQCDIQEMPLKLRANELGLTTTSAPIDFFRLFCDDKFYDEICQETNFYNVQRSTAGFKEAVTNNKHRRTSFRKLKPATTSEIKRVVGIILYMGICKLPNRRMYWGRQTSIPIISSSMPRNRFDELVAIPDGQDGYNRLHKIQPIIDHFRGKFTEIAVPETHQAIDEMMVPFKGHHGAKMYMPKKPVKWGYKIWCRAGISGYVYDFEVIGGKDAKALQLVLKRTNTRCSLTIFSQALK